MSAKDTIRFAIMDKLAEWGGAVTPSKADLFAEEVTEELTRSQYRWALAEVSSRNGTLSPGQRCPCGEMPEWAAIARDTTTDDVGGYQCSCSLEWDTVFFLQPRDRESNDE